MAKHYFVKALWVLGDEDTDVGEDLMKPIIVVGTWLILMKVIIIMELDITL